MKRNHLFDAMRGVAAILVVLHHLRQFGIDFAPNGFLAVDFFFVLSGYVIAQAYEDRLVGGMGIRRFTETRLVRLYPLVLLGIMIGLFKSLGSTLTHRHLSFSMHEIFVSLIFNIFVLPAPTALGTLFPLNSPVWSLFLELLANAAFALLTFRLSRRAIAGIVVAGGIGLIAVSIIQHSTDLGFDWRTSIGGLFRVTYGFTVGQLIFRFRHEFSSTLIGWWAAIPVLVLIVALATPLPPAWQMPWCLATALIISPSIIFVASRIDLPKRWHRISAFLGDLSYPLYAIHAPLLLFFDYPLKRFRAPIIAYPFFLVPTIAIVAIVAARYYDSPIRGRLSRALSVRQSAKTRLI